MIKEEEFDVSLPAPSENLSVPNITTPHLEHPTDLKIKVESPKVKAEVRMPQTTEDELKSEPADLRMDGTISDVNSPIPPNRALKSSSTDDLSCRPSHRPRSPPRGPRAYGGHPRGGSSHQHPSASGSTYPQGSRAPKRRHPQGTFTQGRQKRIYLADGESTELPVKAPNPAIEEMDKAVCDS